MTAWDASNQSEVWSDGVSSNRNYASNGASNGFDGSLILFATTSNDAVITVDLDSLSGELAVACSDGATQVTVIADGSTVINGDQVGQANQLVSLGTFTHITQISFDLE